MASAIMTALLFSFTSWTLMISTSDIAQMEETANVPSRRSEVSPPSVALPTNPFLDAPIRIGLECTLNDSMCLSRNRF